MKREAMIALICVGVFGCGRGSPSPSVATSAAANNGKVTICHFPPGDVLHAQTVSIDYAALSAHLAHHDVVGPCNQLAPAINLQSPNLSPSACCNDPSCDRNAFAKAGGICPGDPRVLGPIPPQVTSASSQRR